jgi:hypothetical protein
MRTSSVIWLLKMPPSTIASFAALAYQRWGGSTSHLVILRAKIETKGTIVSF